MSTLTQQTLIDLFHAQAKSADLWIAQWNRQENRHQDIAALRNVAFAIGKVHGVYNTVVYSTQGNEDLPEIIIQTMARYNNILNDLFIFGKVPPMVI